MNLANAIKLKSLDGAAAGTQATVPDSRSADDWIKKFLDDKNKRLNALRRELNHLIGPEKGEWHAAVREDKKSAFPQSPGKTAQGGRWAVVSPEDEIISTWPSKEEAYRAAFPYWRGLLPSATGPTGGARVKRVRDVRAGGPGSGCQGENCGRPKTVSEVFPLELSKTLMDDDLRERSFDAQSKSSGMRQTIDINKLVATQDKLYPEVLEQYYRTGAIKDAQGELPVLIKDGEKYYIEDGHHRMVAQKLIGLKKVRALVYDASPKEVQAADIFEDPDHGDRTRAKFLKHAKPKVVQDADQLRMADKRPSSHGQGAAGTGGAAGPSGGGT